MNVSKFFWNLYIFTDILHCSIAGSLARRGAAAWLPGDAAGGASSWAAAATAALLVHRLAGPQDARRHRATCLHGGAGGGGTLSRPRSRRRPLQRRHWPYGLLHRRRPRHVPAAPRAERRCARHRVCHAPRQVSLLSKLLISSLLNFECVSRRNLIFFLILYNLKKNASKFCLFLGRVRKSIAH